MTMRCPSILCRNQHQEHRQVRRYPNFAHTKLTNGKAYTCRKCGRTEPKSPARLLAQELGTQITRLTNGTEGRNS